MSSGPVEQFRPMTSTFSASSVASAAEMSVPRSILPPLGSSETEVWIGQRPARLLEGLARAEDGGLDLEDVLGRLDDDEVDAAVDQAARLLGEDRHQLAEADGAQRGVVGCGEVPGRADGAGDEAVLAGRPAGDLGGLAVDLERVLAQAPLVELDARRLEAVGLQDLGAGLDEGGVHALDDVGAVEHEDLVALAGQPAVVLRGEVELLERGAHAAVEDDDAIPDGLAKVAHQISHANKDSANLDISLAMFGRAQNERDRARDARLLRPSRA